jgi:acyl-homoserine lactone acylase PvdQ
VLRINVDLSDLASSRMSLPGRESGRPASKHYDDILPLYTKGDGVPMEMDFQRIEAVGRLVLERQ